MKIPFNCRFCGLETGFLELPAGSPPPQEEVIDIRCTPCELLHGTFQQMETAYKTQIADDQPAFMEFMAENEFKKTKFDIAFVKLKAAKEDGRELADASQSNVQESAAIV